MKPAAVEYRPDIDGLRALAILPVVWFHSDLPGLPGGFTGVDTFFVISGYLITFIIHRGVSAGSFSFQHFYERRIRRIAPPLLFVMLVGSVTAYALLLPYELEEFARTATAAVAMVSNVYFWRKASYFALADSATPLLHTWSLGVEEQFYLFFPAVLIFAERRRAARPAILLIGVGSLLLCLALTPLSPAVAFYLLPTRAWELMLGAAFATNLVSVPHRAKPIAGLTGIALIIAATLLIHSTDPFPGWRATIPAVGAALVIGAGPGTIGSRALGTPLLAYIGRISYSLYLWHWPVLVFFRHGQADLNLPPVAASAGIALSFALAAASYRWVESPARRLTTPYRNVLIACGAGAAALLGLIIIAVLGRGLPQRLPADVDQLAQNHFAFAPLAHACTDIGIDAALEHCHIGPPGKPQLFLIGDSHAAAISEAVGMGVGQPGIVLSMGACAPSTLWTNPDSSGRYRAKCHEFMSRALQLATQDAAISTVVLSAGWTAYDRTGGAAFWNSAQRFVNRLSSRQKRVIVVAGIPDPGADVPWATAIRARFHRPALRLSCPPASIPLRGVGVVDVSAGFCRQPASELFTDSNHPSQVAGETIIAPLVKQALRVPG